MSITLKKILFSLINFHANNDVEIKFLREFSQMIKEFLIELPDYLYALKYTNVLIKTLNLITIKNHFLLRVFIMRYLLHSLKFCRNLHSLTFHKNLDEKKMEKTGSNNIQQNFSPTCLLAMLRLLRTY